MFGFQYQLFHLYPPYKEQSSLMDSLPHILFDHNNEKARAVFLKPIRTLGIWGKDFDENSPAPNIKDAFEIK